MKPTIFITISILWFLAGYGQDIKTVKGIAVDRSYTRIPFCTVARNGTKVSVLANQCGEFDMLTGDEVFTIQFNCGFIPYEKRINPYEVQNGETIVFQIKRYGKTINNGCEK